MYGFATQSVYLTKATHTLRIRGNVSTLALDGGRDLRVFVHNDAWSWNAVVIINKSSTTEAEVSFIPPSEGTYKITAYCYGTGGVNGTAEQTVYLEWYRLKITNHRVDKLWSYCYPNVIDTNQVQVHDGNVYDSRPADGNNLVSLTTSWKRFYMVFKTKPTIPTDVNSVLFRIPKDGNSVYLSQMKLERGVFPTAWTGSNNDTKGYSGAKPYFLKYSEMAGKEIMVYQGVNDEEWYTIVYDDVENTGWYTPKYTHTTTKKDELIDAKWWKSSMNFVATSVFFAQMAYIDNLGVRNVLLSNGKKIEGGMCYSDDDGNGGKLGLDGVRFWLGSEKPSSGTIKGYSDGTFVAANGTAVFYPSGKVTLCGRNATFDEYGNTTIANLTATSGSFNGEVIATSGKFTGEVNATSGTFTNVKINGSMRCTFQQPIEGSFRVDANDNVSLISVANTNSWIHNYTLPWDAGQSGRRITLVNWKWGDKTSTGYATIIAPKSHGFFENGITKDRLKMSREVVELLGYGTDTEFYGWIVLRRENIMTEHEYGRYQRILFWGSVRYYGENDVRLSQAWYDVGNHGATLSRIKEGLYEISFPSGIFTDAGKLLVMVTGFGYSAGYTDKPCKATVVNKTNTSFQVMVSDDDTPNDGGFDFFVANLGDWL